MDLYIYGAGANGRELYHILDKAGDLQKFNKVSYMDKYKYGGCLYGCPIVSPDVVLQRDDKDNYKVIISLSEPKLRLEILNLLKEHGVAMYSNVKDLRFYKQIGEGVVDWGANVLADAIVGDACLLGTNAVIAHDAIIGEGTQVGCNAFVGGNCKIGKGVLIGPGAVIRHNIKIGDNVSIGMGSVVLKNIAADSVVMEPSSKVVLSGREFHNFKA